MDISLNHFDANDELEKLCNFERANHRPCLKNKSAKLFRERAIRKIEEICNPPPQSRCPEISNAWFPYFAINLVDKLNGRILAPTNNQEIDLIVVSCLTMSCSIQKSFKTEKFLLERGLTHSPTEVIDMGLHIIELLECKIKPSTPFCFVRCFSHMLPVSHNLRPVCRIIVWTQADLRFTQFTPSTLAASAMFCGIPSDYAKKIIIDQCISLKMVDLSRCIQMIKTVYTIKLNSQQAKKSCINEQIVLTDVERVINMKLEWIDQMVSNSNDGVGAGTLFKRTFRCIGVMFNCLQAAPPTEPLNEEHDELIKH